MFQINYTNYAILILEEELRRLQNILYKSNYTSTIDKTDFNIQNNIIDLKNAIKSINKEKIMQSNSNI